MPLKVEDVYNLIFSFNKEIKSLPLCGCVIALFYVFMQFIKNAEEDIYKDHFSGYKPN